MQASSERGPVETQLLAYVKRLERNYYDWRAVHLHLSQLKAQNRRDYQLRVAASEFDGLLRQFNSELFQLSNGDIVFLWHTGSFAEVDPVVLRLRFGDCLFDTELRELTRRSAVALSLDGR